MDTEKNETLHGSEKKISMRNIILPFYPLPRYMRVQGHERNYFREKCNSATLIDMCLFAIWEFEVMKKTISVRNAIQQFYKILLSSNSINTCLFGRWFFCKHVSSVHTSDMASLKNKYFISRSLDISSLNEWILM